MATPLGSVEGSIESNKLRDEAIRKRRVQLSEVRSTSISSSWSEDAGPLLVSEPVSFWSYIGVCWCGSRLAPLIFAKRDGRHD